MVYSSSIVPTLPHSANAVIKLSAARETHKNDHHHNARPRTFFFGKTTRRKDVRFSTKEPFINDIETSSFLWPHRRHIWEEWIITYAEDLNFWTPNPFHFGNDKTFWTRPKTIFHYKMSVNLKSNSTAQKNERNLRFIDL